MNPTAPAGRVSPAPIIQLATAYWGSSVLLCANRIGLFALLGLGEQSTAEIASRLGLAPSTSELFLGACASLGLLERRGDAFANSPLASAFLVPGQPGFLGNTLKYSDDLFAVWGRLEHTLRTGGPALPHEAILGDDPEKTRHFVLGMHDRALGIGRSLAEALDLSGRTRLLDVGGGPGTYSILLTQKNPALHSRSMDLPAVIAISRTIIADYKVADRVEAIEGDYTVGPYPANNDAVLCSGMFHRETGESCRAILEKAFAALDPGGVVIVHDVFCDDDKAGPAFALLFGLNMALTARFGTVHARGEVAKWMGEVGFAGMKLQSLPPPWPESLVLGYKPEA